MMVPEHACSSTCTVPTLSDMVFKVALSSSVVWCLMVFNFYLGRIVLGMMQGRERNSSATRLRIDAPRPALSLTGDAARIPPSQCIFNNE
jgi:hypothetical protein